MGTDILQTTFSDEEREQFARRLDHSLQALDDLLARPGFGVGPITIGGELELALVDQARRPMPKNRDVLRHVDDDRLTVELNRFNMEVNLDPCPLAGKPFTAMARQIDVTVSHARREAANEGGDVVTIGILPTVEEKDLQASKLTPLNRYRALCRRMRDLRQESFPVEISGEETISLTGHDISLQGANTSFQVHLRVAPDDFARTFNAAQIATGPCLAAACNSPLFLNHKLWHETRIALFAQSADDRPVAEDNDWRPSRVSFGHGWVRDGAHELFAEGVRQHIPLFAILSEEDPLVMVSDGGVPKLEELRLHQGTLWRWNRAVYDHHAGGHLRIEFRALPSGPTTADMMANAAFLLGLTLGLRDDIDGMLAGMTFGQARQNFYEAAKLGLDGLLVWPTKRPPSPEAQPAQQLIASLIPVARRGLVNHGVDGGEADRWLQVLARRVELRTNGAVWQRETFGMLTERLSREDAVREMTARYIDHSRSGRPVHEWPTRAT